MLFSSSSSHCRLLSSPLSPAPLYPIPIRLPVRTPNRVGWWRRRPGPDPIRASLSMETGGEAMDRFVEVANKMADAAGGVIRKYFRQKFDVIDKDDHSPVTIADQDAEESMVSIILENFPSHAIFGEENGWRCKEDSADYVWVLDPIDGTKSFITGKPLFGTLIALVHKGIPIVGVIDQPVLRERWIGMNGRRTTLNGQEISTRLCEKLSQAYLYTTSPHLFSADAEEAFSRVRNQVKVPLYGCDCYAYALLASGFVDLVIESGLKVYFSGMWLIAVNIYTKNGKSLRSIALADLLSSVSSLGTVTSIMHGWVLVLLTSYECYAWRGLVSLVNINLPPYDFLSLVPVIEGAGGSITDWKGNKLHWEASAASHATSFNVAASGDPQLHEQTLEVLQWK